MKKLAIFVLTGLSLLSAQEAFSYPILGILGSSRCYTLERGICFYKETHSNYVESTATTVRSGNYNVSGKAYIQTSQQNGEIILVNIYRPNNSVESRRLNSIANQRNSLTKAQGLAKLINGHVVYDRLRRRYFVEYIPVNNYNNRNKLIAWLTVINGQNSFVTITYGQSKVPSYKFNAFVNIDKSAYGGVFRRYLRKYISRH